jgi:hypothetical protein
MCAFKNIRNLSGAMPLLKNNQHGSSFGMGQGRRHLRVLLKVQSYVQGLKTVQKIFIQSRLLAFVRGKARKSAE